MKLSRLNLKNISPSEVIVPDEEILNLPEKVLQFGTGRLLRGLPDYYVDKANRKGIFNGRVVVIKSTQHGNTDAFVAQDCLYTLCKRGIKDGKKIEENIICSAISRVLVAQDEWSEILKCAHNENIKIIISNTTEVGIQLVPDNLQHHPPSSYPGKLTAFLYERFKAFDGSSDSGFVIIPTELIVDNGKKLKEIVMELAGLNFKEDGFVEWIEHHNVFCNSLVDRIVTGMPDEDIRNSIEKELGYKDDLLTVSEVYGLWAIEGDEKIRNVLSFAEADEGVVIEPSIETHRELKLRLLNGTHTLTCGLAFLAGYDTVLQTMEDKMSETFMKNLMINEIAPSIPIAINEDLKQAFIVSVLDRFRNPHIQHHWKDITLQYTSKMRMRCIPLLLKYVEMNKTVPPLFTLAFASYLFFMKSVKREDNKYYGQLNDTFYLIQDDEASGFYNFWQEKPIEETVSMVLKESSLWGTDLSKLIDFKQLVLQHLVSVRDDGLKITLQKELNKAISFYES